jgi:fido (protein-threonine AMPylation protein)
MGEGSIAQAIAIWAGSGPRFPKACTPCSAVPATGKRIAHTPTAEIGVRLHHCVLVIHPWPNGNGRHARLLADIIVAARGAPPLTWGAKLDLAHPGLARPRYIEALQCADRNN